jgi:hypothetical protein
MSAVYQALDGQWYFWDETWTERQGPYTSENVANAYARAYACFLEQGPTGCHVECGRVVCCEAHESYPM